MNNKMKLFSKLLFVPLILFVASSAWPYLIWAAPILNINELVFIFIIVNFGFTFLFIFSINQYFKFSTFPSYEAALAFYKEEARVVAAEKLQARLEKQRKEEREREAIKEAAEKKRKEDEEAAKAAFEKRMKELEERKTKVM
jgi:DNA integrity scanning protein DisA with diadenylate cyclase activity